MAEAPADGDAVPTPQRRRRSRSSAEPAAAEPETPPRRRRNRAAASATTDGEADAAEAVSPPAEAEVSLDSEVGQEPPTPPRRRRTRAARAEADAEEPESAETASPVALVDTDNDADRAVAAPVPSEVAGLRALVEQQGRTLSELHVGMLVLADQLDRSARLARLGIFVDVPNVMYGQEPDEQPIDMGKLLDFLRNGRDLIRATAYSPVSDDPTEPMEQQKFVAPFVRFDYRIVTKPLKRFADGSIKGNFDVEMAIDMVTMADRLDVIVIVSGDADFARAVEVVQTRGVRVEVVAFAGSSSLEMRSLADRYIELGAVIDQLR